MHHAETPEAAHRPRLAVWRGADAARPASVRRFAEATVSLTWWAEHRAALPTRSTNPAHACWVTVSLRCRRHSTRSPRSRVAPTLHGATGESDCEALGRRA